MWECDEQNWQMNGKQWTVWSMMFGGLKTEKHCEHSGHFLVGLAGIWHEHGTTFHARNPKSIFLMSFMMNKVGRKKMKINENK